MTQKPPQIGPIFDSTACIPLDRMDYISNSLKILLCKLCNALHAHYIFDSLKISLYKAELSRDFEYVVLCAPRSAVNSRVAVLCAPRRAANALCT